MLTKSLKYGVATTTCLLIDMAIGFLLIEILGHSAALSLTVSTAINTPLLYILSEHVVFNENRDTSTSVTRFLKFVVAVATTFALRQVLIQLLKLFDFGTVHSEYLVLILSICLTFAFSLLLSNYWIFRTDRESNHGDKRS